MFILPIDQDMEVQEMKTIIETIIKKDQINKNGKKL
jgi:hypothetical protein